jgi:hypothetical protein
LTVPGQPNLRPRSAGMPFGAVNRPGFAGHADDLQRHHLLPRQVLKLQAFRPMWDALGRDSIGFNDFRRNGILLPARESAVVRLGLPLHLGPHRAYNAMVIERLGGIEAGWSRLSPRCREQARSTAIMQIRLLQAALRRRILDTRRPLRFNRRDPLGAKRDFTILDRLAEELWRATEP